MMIDAMILTDNFQGGEATSIKVDIYCGISAYPTEHLSLWEPMELAQPEFTALDHRSTAFQKGLLDFCADLRS